MGLSVGEDGLVPRPLVVGFFSASGASASGVNAEALRAGPTALHPSTCHEDLH